MGDGLEGVMIAPAAGMRIASWAPFLRRGMKRTATAPAHERGPTGRGGAAHSIRRCDWPMCLDIRAAEAKFRAPLGYPTVGKAPKCRPMNPQKDPTDALPLLGKL